jgi:DNA-binding transcriptional LysR family regulator
LLDVRRIRLLHELSVHGTIAATAKAAHLSGPAVSQQLATLEREAGLRLLERTGRTLRLTPAGSLLVEHAAVILGGLAAAEADLAGLRAGGRGTVRVAAFPSAARALLPWVWRGLRETAGPVPDLRLAELEPDAAIEALRRSEADVAIVHAYSLLPRVVPAGCEQHRLMDDPVCLALCAGDADRLGLAPGAPVDLGLLAGARWLLPGPETSCHELTRRACGAAGFVPHPVAVATDFAVLTALAAAGAGVALVPSLALPAHTEDDLRLHPLREPIARTISAVTRAGESRQPHLGLVLGAFRAASRGVESETP